LKGLEKSPAYDFEAARVQWEGEWQVVSGALQNGPLLLARADLELVVSEKAPGADQLVTAIRNIRRLAAGPLTSVTPAQNRVATQAWNQLNRFFGFGMHPHTFFGLPSGRSYLAALTAWSHEPLGISDGVRITALRIAVAELERASAASPTAARLYEPAIADLSALEAASRSEVASSGNWTSETSAEITFLNYFFNYSGKLETAVLGGN